MTPPSVRFLGRKVYLGAVVILISAMRQGPTPRRFLELSTDLPIVVECVETEERIRSILPELDNMIGGGLITLERARVIMYRPHRPEDEEADDWSVDVTGSWQAIRPTDQAR